MNKDKVNCKNNSKSFRVQHVSDTTSRVGPSQCNEEIKETVERSNRAMLISQLVNNPEEFLVKDFTSSFQAATRDTDPPHFMTSYKLQPEPKHRSTIPSYPSLVRSLTWNPYVEISSPDIAMAENFQSPEFPDEEPLKCNCKSCISKNCPYKFASGTTFPYRDNIMTFSDRQTMTPRLNDACCGVPSPSFPVTPATSYACLKETVESDYYRYCAPSSILKKPDPSNCIYSSCGHATGHVPAGIRQDSVKDIGPHEDYCEPIKPKRHSFFKFRKKRTSNCPAYPSCPPCPTGPSCPTCVDCGRKVIYNEGICDSVVTSPPRIPTPHVVIENSEYPLETIHERVNDTIRDNIPYAHKHDSKYHYDCKHPSKQPIYHTTDADDNKCVIEIPSPRFRKVQNVSPTITLPRRMLTSQANIESYVEKCRQGTAMVDLIRKKRKRGCVFYEK